MCVLILPVYAAAVCCHLQLCINFAGLQPEVEKRNHTINFHQNDFNSFVLIACRAYFTPLQCVVTCSTKLVG
jgi:hypothetical protein